MTEAEWLTSDQPAPMLRFLRTRTSERKLRLFGTACVRLVSSLGHAEPPAEVLVTEDFADSATTKAALKRARTSVRNQRQGLDRTAPEYSQLWAAYWLAEVAAAERAHVSVLASLTQLQSELSGFRMPEVSALSALVRGIFGNAFRPHTFDSRWRTEAVIALAAGMYKSRDFAAMPVLADALDDAGCADADILAHCRGGGPHVRGCWVVDLVLGKE